MVILALDLPEEKKGRGRSPVTRWSKIQRDLKEAHLPEKTTQDKLAGRRNVKRPEPKQVYKGDKEEMH